MKDTLTKDGAHKLAKTIDSYWKDRGKNYNVRVVHLDRVPYGNSGEIYGVRSDLSFKAPNGGK
jgi:hypothetical protein